MMNDLIADALTRIRNAAMRRLEVATLLHSNTVVGVMNVLLQKEYIAGFKVIDGQNNKKTMGGGLDKYQPCDLNNAYMLDLEVLTVDDIEEIKKIYSKLDKEESLDKLLNELDSIFLRYL